MKGISTAKEQVPSSSSSRSSATTSSTARTEIQPHPTTNAHDDDGEYKRCADEGNTEDTSQNKKPRGEMWLKYRGNRKTRIGDDYQVNVLRKP
jgi:hypothetical protein